MFLIVDDHADTRDLLVRLLRLDGHRATAVACGQEALQYLLSHKPRLVLLDYSMPDMDGLAVFKEMKKDPRIDDVPVIMFSAHDNHIREKALAEGIDAYILKGAFAWAEVRAEIARLTAPTKPS